MSDDWQLEIFLGLNEHETLSIESSVQKMIWQQVNRYKPVYMETRGNKLTMTHKMHCGETRPITKLIILGRYTL